MLMQAMVSFKVNYSLVMVIRHPQGEPQADTPFSQPCRGCGDIEATLLLLC